MLGDYKDDVLLIASQFIMFHRFQIVRAHMLEKSEV